MPARNGIRKPCGLRRGASFSRLLRLPTRQVGPRCGRSSQGALLETRLVYCRDDRRLGHEGAPAVALESRNDSALYNPGVIETLLDALLAQPGAWIHL